MQVSNQVFKPTVYLFVAVFGLWMLASGPYSLPGLAPEGSWMILSFGLASSLGVVLLSRAMGIVDAEIMPFALLWRTLGYLPWLAWNVVTSNLDVMGRIWRMGERIDPVVIKVLASQQGDIGRVTYANSITLTPGTVTIEAEGPVLTVHSIARQVAAQLETGEMDRRIRWIEVGRQATPGEDVEGEG